MQRRTIFIGVEGGATSCTVRIKDLSEDIGEHTVLQGINIISKPNKDVWAIIYNSINHVLKNKSMSLTDHDIRFYACFGLAGAAESTARDNFLKFGQQNYPYFEKLILETDSYITWLGAHATQRGAILIMGTGVVGLYLEDTMRIRVGGYGFPHGDEGGWAWFGLKAINYLFKIMDGCEAPSSVMTHLLEKFFQNDYQKLVKYANGTPRPSSEDYAQIGRYLLTHGQNEAYVIQLIKEAACFLDQTYDALEKKCSLEKAHHFPYCLWGGIIDYVKPYLKKELTQKVVPLKYSPAEGALLKLAQELGVSLYPTSIIQESKSIDKISYELEQFKMPREPIRIIIDYLGLFNQDKLKEPEFQDDNWQKKAVVT